VIEVISEDTAEKDLVRNRRLYLRVPSIEEYWMLDPRPVASRPSLTILRRRGRRWGPAQNFPAGATVTMLALPGFSLILDPPA
jgi:Uma2 family endonuclease